MSVLANFILNGLLFVSYSFLIFLCGVWVGWKFHEFDNK